MRLRVFDALAALCDHLAARRPLVITLDDMQWADTIVWQTVVYLARSLADTRLCLVLAAREEVLRNVTSPAARAIAELNRQRALDRVVLAPLSASDLGLLAGELLGSPPSAALVRLLVERTKGNPFFAEEILGGFREGGALTRTGAGWDVSSGEEGATPVTLRMAVAGRLERLPPETQRVLAAASVLGGAFSASLVTGMVRGEPGEVQAALDLAAVAGVVDANATQGWTFRHDVFRETVHELWAAGETSLHAAAAEQLGAEARRTGERSLFAAVAHHRRLAGEPTLAAEAAGHAAEAATAAHAHAEALTYARLARRLREETAGDGCSSVLVARARRVHGEAALVAGEYPEAEEALRAALAEAEALADSALEGILWAKLGALFRRREAAEEAAGCLERALEVARRVVDEQLESEVLVELASLDGMTRGGMRRPRWRLRARWS